MSNWIRAAANGDAEAASKLKQLDASALPELYRFLTNSRLSALERQVVDWRQRLPTWLQRQVPDPNLKLAAARKAAAAVVAIGDWGDSFPEVVRTACDLRAADAREVWCPIISTAATRVARDPGRHSNSNIIAAFAEGLTNGSPWIRVDCVRALASLGPAAKDALPALRGRLRDPGRTVAQHAAHAVWRISGERRDALELLLLSLSSWDIETLKAATGRLAQIAPAASAGMPTPQALMEQQPRDHRNYQHLPYYCGPGGERLLKYLGRLESNPDALADADLASAAKAAHARLRTVE